MWYETPMTTITLEQIITFLLEAPMFGDLDPGQLSEVVHIMQVRRVRDGQPIFREGDPGDAWYVIFEGGADVTKNNDFGPPKVISQIGPRACFGEMAILDHSPRSATVVARGETTVFRFPRDAFEALLAEDKVLTVRARNTTQQLADALADRAAPQRLRDTSTSLVEGQSLSE
jgi:CRP-like cAMP-binding protein